jgi:hypothetical protein
MLRLIHIENFDINNYKLLLLWQTAVVWGLILNYPFTYKYPTGKYILKIFNPLPLLFKALLHGQKDCVFFSGNLKCIGQQERFRAFRPTRDI